MEIQKEKHAANQIGLITTELLERNRRFAGKLMAFVKRAHQKFLGEQVPPLKIDDNQLAR